MSSVEGGVSMAPAVEVKVAPVISAPTTRGELSKAYPRIQSDFKKIDVSDVLILCYIVYLIT
jgi:hypothetical protein